MNRRCAAKRKFAGVNATTVGTRQNFPNRDAMRAKSFADAFADVTDIAARSATAPATIACLIAAGAYPVIAIDSVRMRREAALAAGADLALDAADPNLRAQLNAFLGVRGVEVVADATGVPDAIPVAMSLACDAGQVVVVGSPRGKAKDVNFYDDLHRRYIEVTGAHGNMLFEPAHTRLAGAWDIHCLSRFGAGIAVLHVTALGIVLKLLRVLSGERIVPGSTGDLRHGTPHLSMPVSPLPHR